MARTRLVSVLFTDLVGSTETIARLGTAAGEAWRKAHVELLREALAASGGREVQALGDGLFAAFESASDAVACAVAMQRRVARANARRDATAPLAVRIGIAVGEATEDAEGLHGLVVVEAARLCAAAKGDQILASAFVQMLCAGRSELRFVSAGTLELKGLPAAVSVVEVTWAPEGGAEIALSNTIALAARGSFVGRATERARLASAWQAARGGERRVVLLAGEPGIGKTRLAAELALEAHAGGAIVLDGRCDEDLSVPFQPWVQALGHYASQCLVDELRARVAESGGELVHILPELARRLPELRVPPRGDLDEERFRLFEAIDLLLVSVSRGTPMLILLDDLHWADKPSLVLLRHLARSARPVALLVVGTYRETDLVRTHPLAEVLADLRREVRVERLRLRGLDEAELGALVAARGEQEAPVAFVRALHEETEGNPFFAEEVLRHLVESGALRREGGHWIADRPLAELGLPEGVREVVAGAFQGSPRSATRRCALPLSSGAISTLERSRLRADRQAMRSSMRSRRRCGHKSLSRCRTRLAATPSRTH